MNKKIKSILAAGVCLYCILFWTKYYSLFPLRLSEYFHGFSGQFSQGEINLISILLPLVSLITILFTSNFLGNKILNVLNLASMGKKEAWPLSCLLGLFILGMIAYFLGIIGLLYVWLFRVLSLGLFISALVHWIVKTRRKAEMERISESDKWTKMLWICFILLSLVCLMYTLTPPIQSDGLRYHLAAPQEYIKQHRIHYIPLSALSNSPFLVEMLFLYGMLLGGDLLAQLLHFSLWVLAIFLIRSFVLYFGGCGENNDRAFPAKNAVGLFAGLLFGSIPAVAILGCWPFIDNGIAAWFLGFVFCICLYRQKKESGLLLLSGIFGGAALGTKYTMIPMILLGCLIIFILDLFDRKFSILSPLTIGITALILALPWFLKNLIYTGNPFYPLLYGIFDGKDWSAANASFYAAKAAGKGFGNSLPLLFLSPFNATFHWDKFESFNPGPLFLFLLPFLIGSLFLLLKKEKRDIFIILISFSIAYYVMWFFGYQSTRFLIPFYGLSAILAGLVLLEIKRISLPASGIFSAGLFLCLIYSSLWSCRWILTEASPHPLPAFLGMKSREQYLSESLDYYPGIRAVNDIVPPDETVLCIGEHRAYYFKPELLISDWFDTPVILDLIRKTKNNDAIFALLKERKCTHLFYNRGELSKYRDLFFRPRFDAEEYRRFEDFLVSPKLSLRYRINDVFIYQIKFDQGGKP